MGFRRDMNSPGVLAQGAVLGCTTMLLAVIIGAVSGDEVTRWLSGALFLIGIALTVFCYRRLRRR
jgi:hypothetical protein